MRLFENDGAVGVLRDNDTCFVLGKRVLDMRCNHAAEAFVYFDVVVEVLKRVEEATPVLHQIDSLRADELHTFEEEWLVGVVVPSDCKR